MSDLPRVLLCSFDVLPGPTGFSRRMTEYLKGLNGRFSAVVLSTKTQDVSHIERYHGSRLLRVPVGAGDLASRLQTFERAIRRQLESEEYALVHFTDPFGGYVLSELKPRYGYRVIYEADSFPSQDLRFTHPALAGDRRLLAKVRRQELFCLMNADLVLTGSQVTRAFIQNLGVTDELIRVLRAPVDLGPYTRGREPDGIPMRVLYIGSQMGWQGLPTLLRAVQRASIQVDVRLTLAGPSHPDYQPRLDDLLKELQLRDKVDQLAPVPHDELPKLLASADLGVLPLDDNERIRAQGASLAKVSEYFAAGRPVLAADLPVCRELLPESATQFFKPGDVEDLAARLVELARAPRRRVEMGSKARAEAVRHLDAVRLRERLLQYYDELIGGRPVSTPDLEDESPESTSLTGTPTGRIPEPRDSGPTPVAFQRRALGDDVPRTDPRGRDVPDSFAHETTDPGGRPGPLVPWSDTEPRRRLEDERPSAAEPRAHGDTDPDARRPTLELTREAVDAMLGGQLDLPKKDATEKRTSRRRKKEKAAKARAAASQPPSAPGLGETGPQPTEQAATIPPLAPEERAAAAADDRAPEASATAEAAPAAVPWAEPHVPPQDVSPAAPSGAPAAGPRVEVPSFVPVLGIPLPAMLANPPIPEPPRYVQGLPPVGAATLGFGPEQRTEPMASALKELRPEAAPAKPRPSAEATPWSHEVTQEIALRSTPDAQAPGTAAASAATPEAAAPARKEADVPVGAAPVSAPVVPAAAVPEQPAAPAAASAEKAPDASAAPEARPAPLASAAEPAAATSPPAATAPPPATDTLAPAKSATPASPVPEPAAAAPESAAPPKAVTPPAPAPEPDAAASSPSPDSAARTKPVTPSAPVPEPAAAASSPAPDFADRTKPVTPPAPVQEPAAAASSPSLDSAARIKSVSPPGPLLETLPGTTPLPTPDSGPRSKLGLPAAPPVLFPTPPPASVSFPESASDTGARAKSTGAPPVLFPTPMPAANPLPPLDPSARQRPLPPLPTPVLQPDPAKSASPRASLPSPSPALQPEFTARPASSLGPSDATPDPTRPRAPVPGTSPTLFPAPGARPASTLAPSDATPDPTGPRTGAWPIAAPDSLSKPGAAADLASRAKPSSPPVLSPEGGAKPAAAAPPNPTPEPPARVKSTAPGLPPPVLPEPPARGKAPPLPPPVLYPEPAPRPAPDEASRAKPPALPASESGPRAVPFPPPPPLPAPDASRAARPAPAPEDEPEEVFDELVEEVPEASAEVLVEEVSADDAEELPEAAALEVSDAEELVEDAAELAEEAAEEIAEDTAREIADELSADAAEELVDDAAEELPADAAEELLEDAAALVEADEVAALPAEEAHAEITPEEIEEADGPGPELPSSRIDPWLAQLAYGYCPPEGIRFARHTPPTTFPGRDTPVAPRAPKTGESPAAVPPQNPKG